ncbi:MAG: GNAT family N-acetyltransferase [Chloroflexota bacterium]
MSELTFVNLKPAHAAQLAQLQLICFPTTPPDELFTESDFLHHATLFPEGTFVGLDRDQVVALGAGIFLDFDFAHPQHTLDEITGGGKYEAHNPDGDYYYGTDISVHPEYRRRGIGKQLYALRKDVVIRYNKKGIVAGGVLPGFVHHKDKISALAYVTQVSAGKLYDPTLSFQVENGFEVRGVLKDYFPDSLSDGWASLIVWENPQYQND